MKNLRWTTIVTAGLLLVSLPLTVFLATRINTSEYRTKAAGGGGGELVAVFFRPAGIAVSADETVVLEVKIDTGLEVVGGVDIFLDYDPGRLSLETTEAGTAFPGLVIERSPGRVTLRGEGDLLGLATMARLRFHALRSGEAAVKIGNDSVVWKQRGKTSLGIRPTAARVVIE